MGKIWFHIPSMDTTIDLQFASEIIWNERTKKGDFFTTVFLGTSMAAVINNGVIYNKILITEDADRRVLREFFPDIPIALHLNSDCEDRDAYVGEAALNRYIDPEELNIDR